TVWTYHSKNLPTAPVTQIEVVQDMIGRRVVASTYGRGIWASEPAPPKRVTRYYVNKTASGANDGSSWPNAFFKIQDAIDKAIPGDTIWVAKGTYYPTSIYNITGGSAARLYTFIVDNNTTIYGGFNGTETNINQRNTTLNETTLSGDIGAPVTATDNSYHVLTILNAAKNSTIDGFTIRDGFANGTNSIYPSLYRGGALLLSYDSANAGRPFFRNCFFANNLAAQGGAVYISQYFKRDAKTSFLKCTFSQNYTFNNLYGERGGAICLDASPASNGPYGKLSMAIDSCIFQYNNSPYGGAIYNDADNAGNISYTINQTQFLHNKTITAAGYGGAIFNYTSNKGILTLNVNDCTFLDDDAPNAGGGIYNSGSATLNDDSAKVYIKNCSFDSCSGYAVYLSQGKVSLSVNKSTFTNNTGGIAAIGSTVIGVNTGIITNCSFNNTVTGINLSCNNSGTGNTNKSLNYTIDSCTFNNNSYGLYAYNYSYGGNAKQVQYTLNNSTFTGNTTGAVYSFGSDNGNIIATMKKNTFNNNKGTYGAAVFSSTNSGGYAEMSLDSCSFTGNKATTSGGAIYSYSVEKFAVTNCNFNNDTAVSAGAVYCSAPYKNAIFTNTFRNNTYTNNVATGSAGALLLSNGYFAAMNIDMVRNTFTGNKAANYGGSMYVSSDATYDTLNLNMDSCTFNNNTTTLNTTQSHGGALYLYSLGGTLTPSIKNTEFKNNHTAARGGAIYSETGAYNKLNLSIFKCNIESNSSGLYGGALTFNSLGTSNLNMDSCTLKNNSAVSAIGGIYIYQSSFQLNASITNTTFDGNTTPAYSGALQINADGPITGGATNCVFKNNTANGGVAGAVRLYAYDADLNDFDFTNCLFDNNTATDNGGAAYIQTDLRGIFANKFDNCVFNKNKAARGGALYLTASNYAANISVPLTNCTIANNNATIETGGVYVTKTNTSAIVHADLINTILWGNTDAAATANKKQAYVSANATGFVKNSLIKDSIPAGFADSTGNVFTDPLFINATDVDGTDNIFATADDGYALQTGSPAQNTGATVSLTQDITGLSRPQGLLYDMGAYEINGCINPDMPSISGNSTICRGDSVTLTVSGNLNSADHWQWYNSGCGTGPVATGTVYKFAPASDITIFVRGEGGCISAGVCISKTITVNAKPASVSDLAASAITSCSIAYTWSAAAGTASYEASYKQTSSGTWISLGNIGLVIQKTITGLIANSSYDFRLRAKNISGCTSSWTQLLKKKTDLYNEPENPSETNITSISARLQWQVPACDIAPVNYTIKWKASSSITWITVNVSNAFYKVQGLNPSTQYTWQVVANYAGGSSAYTALRNFTTLSAQAVSAGSSALKGQIIKDNAPSILLEQNIPNPFNGKTIINCYIPVNNNHAYLNIYSQSSIILRAIKLPVSGMNTITFDAGKLAAGTYRYALVIDGKIVDSKPMVIIK
ncbi:MAG TPA: fibronectin type III domain-containing protein, partial [Panacibacter sp.]|nr:fibronectin type III domain-containing protein [Panacibacter sp.]